ncbi:hypothetical protein ACO0LF_00165 [Undibacterium sp. Di27W]
MDDSLFFKICEQKQLERCLHLFDLYLTRLATGCLWECTWRSSKKAMKEGKVENGICSPKTKKALE